MNNNNKKRITNHIIVGVNGRPSMKEVMKQMDSDAILYIRSVGKNKLNIWRRYQSVTGIQLPNGAPSFAKGDTVIRWGNRIDLTPYGPIKDILAYNMPKYAKNAVNKAEARILLAEADIPIPKIVFSLDTCTYPIVVRPLQHRGGKQLYVCNNKRDANIQIGRLGGLAQCYLAEVYPKTREFRLHVGHGKVLFIKEKPAPDDKSRVAWNQAVNHEEWAIIERKDYNPDMCNISLEALEALGLDFGAVDVMSYPTKKKLPKHVICEVNTAPTLTPYGVQRWGMYFDWLFRAKKRRDHWGFWEFDEGDSFAWKNFQLNDEKIKK